MYIICVWFDYTSVLRCVFENVCVRFVCTSCVDRMAVCFMSVWEYIFISLACLANALWGTTLHLQHRHVFILFHMRCMLAILEMHIPCICISVTFVVCVLDWRGCFLREARTCPALTHWHARTRTDVHGKVLRWRKRVSLTVSSLLPTGELTSTTTNCPRCRTQSSPDWAPWSK